MVISAGQRGGKYYCQDEADYLDCYRDIIGSLAQKEALADKKIVLLAHTFGRYGDETEYVRKLYDRLPGALKERTVPVTDKIFQTRARFVLGNGLFTVTGRMHAAGLYVPDGASGGLPLVQYEIPRCDRWQSRTGRSGDRSRRQCSVAQSPDRRSGMRPGRSGTCGIQGTRERIGSRVKELQRQVAVTLDEISSERPAGRKPVQ